MATFVLIIHEYDRLSRWRLLSPSSQDYLICDVLSELRRRGHTVHVKAGADHEPDGDVAFLHVDCTVVPQTYIDLARRFPITLNDKVVDITKRQVSQALIDRESDWSGPVIVKSNYNAIAYRERAHNRKARRRGRPPPHRDFEHLPPYVTYPSMQHVPESNWLDDDLVIEKFIPEIYDDGYGMRIWDFLGDAERCTRYVSPDMIIKSGSKMSYEPAPVPDELRGFRRQLGFDYGKWDFVMHEGRAVLVDANKTPGRPGNKEGRRDRMAREFADELESLV